MRRITLSPIPTMQFHLWHSHDPANGPVRWRDGYYDLPSGECVNWPKVEERRWLPSYWLLWMRVWLFGSVTLGSIDPISKRPYIATFDDEPTFACVNEMMGYVGRKNGAH